MRARSSISEIDAQIEKLREKRRGILAKANERFARAAAKAGLAELEISDNELDAIFEEIAARFRKSGKGLQRHRLSASIGAFWVWREGGGRQ
ncbi:pilus assembly protein [Ochrobactrum grignonense]|nr:pilus assembly protein [Brucella grignonensis]